MHSENFKRNQPISKGEIKGNVCPEMLCNRDWHMTVHLWFLSEALLLLISWKEFAYSYVLEVETHTCACSAFLTAEVCPELMCRQHADCKALNGHGTLLWGLPSFSVYESCFSVFCVSATEHMGKKMLNSDAKNIKGTYVWDMSSLIDYWGNLGNLVLKYE